MTIKKPATRGRPRRFDPEAGLAQAQALFHARGYDGVTVADLTDAPEVPSDSYDCVILTQTLHLIFDMSAALRTIQRILKPGGVLLCTVPGISQVADGSLVTLGSAAGEVDRARAGRVVTVAQL